MKSKTQSLDLKFEATPREIVFSLMGDIEQCRQNKKTLRQIHKALSQRDDFSLSFSQLRNHYYQLRKQGCDESLVRKQVASATIVTDAVAPTLDESFLNSSEQEPKNRVFQSESTSSANVEKKPAIGEAQPFVRLEIGGTLEQRRAIARAHFNQ